MRIVQVANFYGPRSGGLRTAVDELGTGYVRRGHHVTLIVPGPVAANEVLASGVVRVTVPAPVLPFTGGYRAARFASVAAVAASAAPDVIEVSDRLTLRRMGVWARERDVGSVMIAHERLDRLLGQVLPRAVAQTLADVANRATARDYDKVVCTTAFAAEEFDRIGASNLCRVPLGVDLEVFHPERRSAALRDLARRGAEHLLIHCGRLSVEKHVHRSVDAVALLRDSGISVRLLIVGDGPVMRKLKRRAEGLPVDFAGYLGSRAEVAALMASSDVALAPGPHETFGLAALEALATGTPVVVSQRSALSEIVRAESGALAPDTAMGVAQAILAVLDLPAAQRRSLARERAEQFSWPHAVDGMLAAFVG
ncbi:glycosyltransferase [Williamsia sp. 1135]|uniref:glycosyltransferase n=1 Tax=Williamsia sp. 1135 TaxID=1889262 RepID=UPI000A11B116|nr:glycosyltransferase [Williamsia sp. 1135]ORM32466.1 alpha-(1-2)-phosphatidylinositol mannosyltransferase [Williamsia sp. 1135]